MHILALNPYHTGSHAAFLDTWRAHSRHTFTTLTLPGRHWKWRMRNAAITFAKQLHDDPIHADAIFTTDMCNAAELRALLPRRLRDTPLTLYMHENQLTYPPNPHRPHPPHETERDLHLSMTNLVSALAADHVWFNSAYHRDNFLGALPTLIRQLPDNPPTHAINDIADKSSIQYPPVPITPRAPPDPPDPSARRSAPHLLLTNSRWEHDKNPDTLFDALFRLADTDTPFRLAVLGERYTKAPPIYRQAQEQLADHIEHWGYIESVDDYHAALARATFVISTAHHEFFGIAVLEAVAAGALPLVPDALAYPETLAPADITTAHDPFHDNTAEGLAHRLAAALNDPPAHAEHQAWAEHVTTRFNPTTRARAMDDAVEHQSVT